VHVHRKHTTKRRDVNAVNAVKLPHNFTAVVVATLCKFGLDLLSAGDRARACA
jgi:hypothetical protein